MIRTNLESLVLRGSVVVGGLADVRPGTSVRTLATFATGHPDYPWPGTKPNMGGTQTQGTTLRTGRSCCLSRNSCCSSASRRSLRAGGCRTAAGLSGLAQRAASVSETARGAKAGYQGRTPPRSTWETDAR